MTRFALTVALALTLLLGGVSEAAKSTRHHRTPTPRPRVAEVTKGGVQFVPVALEGSLRSSWTQYGPGGVLEARAVVEGAACPYIFIDLQRSLMAPHNVADEKFLTVCAAAIPAGTRQAALAFPLLHAPLPPSGAGEDVWKEWIEKETGLPVPGPGTTEFDRQKWRDEIAARAKYAAPIAICRYAPSSSAHCCWSELFGYSSTSIHRRAASRRLLQCSASIAWASISRRPR